MQEELKVLQINANRSRNSIDACWEVALRKGLHVIILSEPNIAAVSGSNWLTDIKMDCAIGMVDSRLVTLRSGQGEGFVWMEFSKFVIYSCYYSPNMAIEDFESSLDFLCEDMLRQMKPIVLAGDFNARLRAWGDTVDSPRGARLADMVAQLDLLCLNIGSEPTYIREGWGSSVIDLTFVSGSLIGKAEEWSIMEEETLSDHRALYFCLRDEIKRAPRTCRLRVRPERREEFMDAMQRVSPRVEVSPEELSAISKETAISCGYLHESTPKKKGVFWWSEEIAALRQACVRARRVAQRRRRRVGAAENLDGYRQARAEYKKAIAKAKEKCWRDLCDELEEDPWGMAFRIVTKKFGRKLPVLSRAQMLQTLGLLFPTGNAFPREEIVAEEIPRFSMEELLDAARSLGVGKSPGLDNIPAEIVITTVAVDPVRVLQSMNWVLEYDSIPESWKCAKVVLLRKEGKPADDPAAYRPICLIGMFAKLWEKMIGARLTAEIGTHGGFSDKQYGFRRGYSTIDAVKRVMGLVEDAAAGTWRTRRIPAVVMLDIKNAFNSLPWQAIFMAMKRKGLSSYLRRAIEGYLEDRSVVGISDEGEVRYPVTMGVPQGSVIGPTLWNLVYDEVLELVYPEGVTPIAFADDLALVVVAKDEDEVIRAGESAIETVKVWLGRVGLSLAVEKTQIVVMTGRRKLRKIGMRIGGQLIEEVPAAKYLGVWLDKRRTFTSHVQETAKKAERMVTALTRLMGNAYGPGTRRRRILGQVHTSILLYGAPVWAAAMERQRTRRLFLRQQRQICLKIIAAYRTVSLEAALVIAGTPPVDLQARMMERIKNGGGREEAKADLFHSWQERWDECGVGRWTHTLIPSVREWSERKFGEVGFEMTQILSGHGCFNKYLHQRGRKASEECKYCGGIDDARHVLYECPRWRDERETCEGHLGALDESNMIKTMLESSEKWAVIETYIRTIMRIKFREERNEEL